MKKITTIAIVILVLISVFTGCTRTTHTTQTESGYFKSVNVDMNRFTLAISKMVKQTGEEGFVYKTLKNRGVFGPIDEDKELFSFEMVSPDLWLINGIEVYYPTYGKSSSRGMTLVGLSASGAKVRLNRRDGTVVVDNDVKVHIWNLNENKQVIYSGPEYAVIFDKSSAKISYVRFMKVIATYKVTGLTFRGKSFYVKDAEGFNQEVPIPVLEDVIK